MFFEVFQSLCDLHEMTPTYASTVIGFSKGSVSYWRKQYKSGIDAKPDVNTAQKIADYFGVSVDFLLERSPSPVSDDFATPVSRNRPLVMRDNPLSIFRDEPLLTEYELLIIAEYRTNEELREKVDKIINSRYPHISKDN